MDKIQIAVGSTRRPKLAAVNEAIRDFGAVLAPGAEFEIVGMEVESGVGHTPANLQELMLGARQRAEGLVRLAREKTESWRYFVGLEGGLDIIEEEDGRRVLLESWAYVSDGRNGHYGRSGAVEIPDPAPSAIWSPLAEILRRKAHHLIEQDAVGVGVVIGRDDLASRGGGFSEQVAHL